MPLPASFDIPALSDWLYAAWVGDSSDYNVAPTTRQARAVRALLERVALDAANRGKYTTPAEAVRQAMGGVS